MLNRYRRLIALLCFASTGAFAQSLPHGVSIDGMNALKQGDGLWQISAQVTNHRETAVPALQVVYALYDAQGQEIGRVESRRDTALAPGETWQAQASTPQPFTRFSAKEIKEVSGQP
ncbi:FxLYD domain-containing protein [Bordetella sp. 15P40C-2]|uniref:FxLYD domain-containing protein n=1 Tax=Bordetella sp. 15P40C-2 TaxID=2572246 RepID=UPI00132227FF|nr:FxLYD domain-containing protein [Bordetella sp. 15P40C-2]MVW72009.1 ASCH domain-containing protein [Bordetella sp. 15P40C-2]